MQVCGLWPYVVSAQTPSVGVPMGFSLQTGATVCCDPINWFEKANLIFNPSAFVLGLPGLGKSTTIRHMLTGLHYQDVVPLILGDLKGEYIDLVRKLGGQVIRLGVGGRGYLNVLDPGNGLEAIRLLRTKNLYDEADAIMKDIEMRQLNLVTGLVAISRKSNTTDRETNLIAKALSSLNQLALDEGKTPVLNDLLELIRTPNAEMSYVVRDRGDKDKYQDIIENLDVSLTGLIEGNQLGEIFSKQTSEPMQLDKPVCFDVSSIPDTQLDLQGAALLACWSEGFANLEISHVLADNGLAPRRKYIVAIDELWRALRSAGGMVDRVDALTRLNRSYGTGMIMATHTVKDFEALALEEDRAKAANFIRNAGIVMTAGLDSVEVELLRKIVYISKAEEKEIISWSTPPGLEAESSPAGAGKIMIKIAQRPGIPIKVLLVPGEAEVNDTNKRWDK